MANPGDIPLTTKKLKQLKQIIARGQEDLDDKPPRNSVEILATVALFIIVEVIDEELKEREKSGT